MHRLLMLSLLCLGACKHTTTPEPPGPGVFVSVPGVRVHVSDSPRPAMVDETSSSRGGAAR